MINCIVSAAIWDMLWARNVFIICRVQVVCVCVCVCGGEGVHFSNSFSRYDSWEKGIISFVKNVPYRCVWNIIVETF